MLSKQIPPKEKFVIVHLKANINFPTKRSTMCERASMAAPSQGKDEEKEKEQPVAARRDEWLTGALHS